ncbi:MAG: glycine cleavage system protein T, partial [Actinomycetota bacterium]|nr:glycine cleavage system protein T [Actinomycetota bacterium]
MSFSIGPGSRIRKSPYFEALVAHGLTHMTTYNHMYMPASFGDPDAEYEALVERVSLWDVACERQVEVVGPDAFELVQYVSARDMAGCAVGRVRYAPVCDHDGTLLNDPMILKLAEDRFWFSIADSDL